MRRILIGLLLTIAVRGHGVVAGEDTPQASETYTVECTFSNPSYSGHCLVSEVAPRSLPPRSACERILTCLNDARCTRSYCSATAIRGGWKLESAGEQERP